MRLDLSRPRSTTGKQRLDFSDLYSPFPRQIEFHESKAKYRLFGGAAGPGKTKALLWEAIYQAHEVAGADTLLLRRTYPECSGRSSLLLAQFRRDVPRSLYKKYNESKHVVTWLNGSTTRFGYCRNENDVYQYQGAEFLFIGLDELTHFTLKQWQFLTSRNRCPEKLYASGVNQGKRIFPCMAGATNPGNIGHAWVKSLWIDRKPHRPVADCRSHVFTNVTITNLFGRVARATTRSTRMTSSIAAPSMCCPGTCVAHFSTATGTSSQDSISTYSITAGTPRGPKRSGLKHGGPAGFRSTGKFQHPSAVYWHCAVPAEANSRQLTADRRTAQFDSTPSAIGCEMSALGSRIVTYREFVQNGLSPRMLAQGIAERSGRENISDVILSPDAFAHRTAEASIAEQLGDVLTTNGLPRPSSADDDRVGGWQFMYQLLESNAWVITENCIKLIECMPTLVRDNARSEDIRKMDGDDPADSARYGLVSGGRIAGVGTAFGPSRAGQPPPLKPPGSGAHFVTGMPLAEQIARQVSATDPTSQAIHYQRLEAEACAETVPAAKPRPRRR